MTTTHITSIHFKKSPITDLMNPTFHPASFTAGASKKSVCLLYSVHILCESDIGFSSNTCDCTFTYGGATYFSLCGITSLYSF